MGSTVNWVLPMCLPIPVVLFLMRCCQLLLMTTKPIPYRMGFFLIFIQHLRNTLPGFCHGEGIVLCFISSMAHTAILSDFIVSFGQFNVRDKIISDLPVCAAQFFV